LSFKPGSGESLPLLLPEDVLRKTLADCPFAPEAIVRARVQNCGTNVFRKSAGDSRQLRTTDQQPTIFV
jgi:hypothetical protein